MSIIYRYGVSLLSRNNHIKAENEELMVDKETGQILLKRVDGKVMSYDSMARFAQSMDRITSTAAGHLIFGKIYNVLPENRDLPSAFDNNEEILSGGEMIEFGPVSTLLLQLDVDVYDNESKFGDSKSLEDILVHLSMNHGGVDIEKDIKLIELNSSPLEFQDKQDLIIKSIKVDDQEVVSTSHFVINNILTLIV